MPICSSGFFHHCGYGFFVDWGHFIVFPPRVGSREARPWCAVRIRLCSDFEIEAPLLFTMHRWSFSAGNCYCRQLQPSPYWWRMLGVPLSSFRSLCALLWVSPRSTLVRTNPKLCINGLVHGRGLYIFLVLVHLLLERKSSWKQLIVQYLQAGYTRSTWGCWLCSAQTLSTFWPAWMAWKLVKLFSSLVR